MRNDNFRRERFQTVPYGDVWSSRDAALVASTPTSQAQLKSSLAMLKQRTAQTKANNKRLTLPRNEV
jgi:hypothetical protein